MVKSSLIEIHPSLDAKASCPKCHSERTVIGGFLFEGIHVLLDCGCLECKTDFFQTLPIGHDALWPTVFTKDGIIRKHDKIADVWLSAPLIHAMTSGTPSTLEIEKKIYSEPKANAILLNCLDDCFGHAFLKLLNAQTLLESHPDFSIIVLLSKNLEWLIPQGVSEAWIVNGRMSDMSSHIGNLDGMVRSQFARFSKLYVYDAKLYHDTSKIDFGPFLKTKKFDVSRFAQLPPRVTFVLREDRFWHSNRFEEFLNKVFIKLKWTRYSAGYFVKRQNALVKKTIDMIRARNPEVRFSITGFGNKSFDDDVQDRRVKSVTQKIEKEWCDIYAESHIIIGVHGSNMLIPTALSAGFIEILPDHKIPHVGEDTVAHYSGRYSVLLGRHVDGLISPKQLADHVLHMLSYKELQERVER